MGQKNNTEGREANDALPLGEIPDKDTAKTGRKEQRTAGPDGGDSREVGDTFKNGPDRRA